MKMLRYCVALVVLIGVVAVASLGFAVEIGSSFDAGLVAAAADCMDDDPYTLLLCDQVLDYYESTGVIIIPRGEMRGVWVPTVFRLDFPSVVNPTPATMMRDIDLIVERTAELGFNAIFFQVRPMADAFYPSEIFPWSYWLTGEQGRSALYGFDPLAYIIERAYSRGIEVHAWVNPYRVIHTATNSHDLDILAPNNPARLNPDWVLRHTSAAGRKGVIFNPGLPEVRQLILDGFEELIRNYPLLAGIHIDDYFYMHPATIDDSWAFYAYGGGLSLYDWRRENVNILIRDTQTLIRGLNYELGRDVRWGVSPFAVWMNESSHPLGVPTTRANQSYTAMFADTRLWVTEEWVDYIIPQIYWHIGFEIADFEAVLHWWVDLASDTNVDLYIGQGVFREYDNHTGWESGETIRQLEMIEGLGDAVQGAVFYRLWNLHGDLGDTIRDFYIEKDERLGNERQMVAPIEPVIILDTLGIGFPRTDVSIALASGQDAGHNIIGTSDPNYPLYMNGQEVTNRTVEGFFAVFVPLNEGANQFTFTQEGQSAITRTITRTEARPTQPVQPPTITWLTSPYYVTINSDAAWVFRNSGLSGGSDFMMTRGQIERVLAETNRGGVLLSSGVWIHRDFVSVRNQEYSIYNVLHGGIYHAGEHYDIIAWQADIFTGVYAYFDSRHLTVQFGMHTAPPPLTLPNLAYTMFSDVRSGATYNMAYYIFTICEHSRFEGHYIDFADGELRLHLKRRKTLADGDKPLYGIVFVLDAGHGGTDPGALGPMGTELAEKHIVLTQTLLLAESLTNLGATVHLTRYDDVTLTLGQRVDLTRQIRPDMFISLHNDSVAATTNAANIRGLSVWYRNPNSAPLAQTILDFTRFVNPDTNRNPSIRQANFFVCRPTWTPAIIIEASFMINIQDFVWLIDPVAQAHYVDILTKAILAYFALY